MITRDCIRELLSAASEYPVVTVLGPRQSGKTTLVQAAFPDKPYRSLEDPDLRLLAQQDPRGFLADLPKGAILDEIQRAPDLLSYIQGLVDKPGVRGRFILTGSHQPEVHKVVSQSLAGRTAILTLLPFSLAELRHYRASWDPFELMVMGTFPRLHEEGLKPDRFFNGYIQTYLERDVRALINLKDLRRFQQFLTLLAGRVGQRVNYASLANDVGVTATTIKDWISVLIASFVVFELPPYHENISKRVVKSPKLYFVDAGIAAHLVGIRTAEQVARDPLRGGLYENLVIADILKSRLNRGGNAELFFYRDSHGNEVDLVLREGRSLVPVEIKSAATFSDDFHRGISRFHEAVGKRALPGLILYNGEQSLTFRDTRVRNPLRTPDLGL
ncbi:MAG: ATP-binding protein [Phycisphaeraceae bacterium]|nr:ATP-binding protein [Phycisphaeraceae bacterium]